MTNTVTWRNQHSDAAPHVDLEPTLPRLFERDSCRWRAKSSTLSEQLGALCAGGNIGVIRRGVEMVLQALIDTSSGR